MEKLPNIYKNSKINNEAQDNYYYRNINDEIITNTELENKVKRILNDENFIYRASVNIMYKNGDIITKKIIGLKNNKILTIENEEIDLNDIKDIK